MGWLWLALPDIMAGYAAESVRLRGLRVESRSPIGVPGAGVDVLIMGVPTPAAAAPLAGGSPCGPQSVSGAGCTRGLLGEMNERPPSLVGRGMVGTLCVRPMGLVGTDCSPAPPGDEFVGLTGNVVGLRGEDEVA